MKYSQMTAAQRKVLLEDEDNYPMYVTFLNKIGLVTHQQVAFLIEHGVDFDVDDRLAEALFGEAAVLAAAIEERTSREEVVRVYETINEEMTPERRAHLHQIALDLLSLFVRAGTATIRLILRVIRSFLPLQDLLVAVITAFASYVSALMWIVRQLAGYFRLPWRRR